MNLLKLIVHVQSQIWNIFWPLEHFCAGSLCTEILSMISSACRNDGKKNIDSSVWKSAATERQQCKDKPREKQTQQCFTPHYIWIKVI